MEYPLELKVADKPISFVKNVKMAAPNEVTNPEIVKSIRAYEEGRIVPIPVQLEHLKAMLHA